LPTASVAVPSPCTPTNGSDNVAWDVLAVGAYRARVLGWVPALGVAFMITHYGGVLKGTDLKRRRRETTDRRRSSGGCAGWSGGQPETTEQEPVSSDCG
jgi:hypothetical protein